jgi:hypothetical protein
VRSRGVLLTGASAVNDPEHFGVSQPVITTRRLLDLPEPVGSPITGAVLDGSRLELDDVTWYQSGVSPQRAAIEPEVVGQRDSRLSAPNVPKQNCVETMPTGLSGSETGKYSGDPDLPSNPGFQISPCGGTHEQLHDGILADPTVRPASLPAHSAASNSRLIKLRRIVNISPANLPAVALVFRKSSIYNVFSPQLRI